MVALGHVSIRLLHVCTDVQFSLVFHLGYDQRCPLQRHIFRNSLKDVA